MFSGMPPVADIEWCGRAPKIRAPGGKPVPDRPSRAGKVCRRTPHLILESDRPKRKPAGRPVARACSREPAPLPIPGVKVPHDKAADRY
jgi:hypothetical protein